MKCGSPWLVIYTGDKSGLGLGWVDFVLVFSLPAKDNQNLVNQTQSETGLVTL